MDEMQLTNFAKKELGKEFVWGETNCVALSIRWIDELTEQNLMQKYKRCMSSKERAYIWTKKNSARQLVDKFIEHGLTEVNLNFAQPGDLLIGETEDGQIASHILLSNNVLSSTASTGVTVFALKNINPMPKWAVGKR